MAEFLLGMLIVFCVIMIAYIAVFAAAGRADSGLLAGSFAARAGFRRKLLAAYIARAAMLLAKCVFHLYPSGVIVVAQITVRRGTDITKSEILACSIAAIAVLYFKIIAKTATTGMIHSVTIQQIG
ncbi:MAG: hypothetical protein ACOYIH_03800 [Candidatus Fimadaptatus sp.]